jgi:hypothetical protein
MIAWKLSQIEKLFPYKLREKQQILALAISELSAKQKVCLRISKLCVLIPFFIMFAHIKGWLIIPMLLLAGLLYPLLTSPIDIWFAKPHFTKAISLFEQKNTTQAN